MQLPDPGTWAVETFGCAALGQAARTKRLVQVAATIAQRPAASLPQLFPDAHQLKATYRFFNQRAVRAPAILAPVVNTSVLRCAEFRKVLLLADSSSADYTGRAAARGLGETSNRTGQGLLFHTVLAVDAASHQVAGPLAQTRWVRRRYKASNAERSRERRARARESERWPACVREAVTVVREGLVTPPELVLVTDREGDAFDLYAACQALDCGYVIRIAQTHRRLDPEASDGASHLDAAVEQAPVRLTTTLTLAAGPGRAARVARLEVRTATVSLWPPEGLRATANPLEVNLVHVREVDAPRGVTPLQWWLATSEPIETEGEVLAVIRMYQARWLIEELHMGIKTGCALEERQLRDRAALEKLLVLSTAIAGELLRLRHLARTVPETDAAVVLGPRKLALLRALRPQMPARVTAYEALRWVANLGGFLMRTRDGEPGWRTLWKGYQDLLLLERASNSLATFG